MKKKNQKSTLLLAVLLLTACEKVVLDDDGGTHLRFIPTTADTRGTVSIGDYFSRLAVQLFDADGQKVWSQSKTQTRDDDDFGTLSVGLTAGTYAVVAVGHSSPVTPTIKSTELVQFTAKDGVKNSDTFCHYGTVTVSEDGGYHELKMNRVTAMVRLRLTDTQMPQSFARLKVDYSGGSANFNPTTFEGCTKSNQSETRLAQGADYCVFTFPYLAKSCTLKMTLSAFTADGTVLTQKTISDVPVTRNRITTYSGTLFDDTPGDITQTAFGLSVNPEWDGEDFYHFSRPVTFNMSGDFTFSPLTRSLTADGKDMTDVWVLDYVGTECQQTVHQTAADADFGTPTMTLSLGTHHLYFVASRGVGASLNTTTHALMFTSVRDTFWKDYEITISSGTSSGNRSVALDRIVTKLKLTFTDVIPEGAATFNVTPATWYYGMNYQTGEPVSPVNSQPVTVNIPSSEIGVPNEAVSIFGFSSSDEWTTDVEVACKKNNGSTL